MNEKSRTLVGYIGGRERQVQNQSAARTRIRCLLWLGCCVIWAAAGCGLCFGLACGLAATHPILAATIYGWAWLSCGCSALGLIAAAIRDWPRGPAERRSWS